MFKVDGSNGTNIGSITIWTLLLEFKNLLDLLHTACGTPAYVSPEIITRKGYDGAGYDGAKSDIWSCGAISFMVMAGYRPFEDANVMVMYKKIYKGDFKCPPWFSSEVRSLVLRLLDPKPRTRITIAQLMEVPWFCRGFKRLQADNDIDDGLGENVDNAFCTLRPACLNAFDIISSSPCFSLSGLFKGTALKPGEDSRFTSVQSASSIISELEEIARLFRLSFKKSKDCKVQLQGSDQRCKRHLRIDAVIFEATPSTYLVELRKLAGDKLEYSKFCSRELKPRLKDMVSAWEGEN